VAALVGRRAIGLVVIGVLMVAGLVGCGSKPQAAANYSTTVQGSVVVAGKQAPTTVDVYEDFLCPICGRFEANFGGDMTQAINDGKIQVRYHPVAILNRGTNPTGYSLRAANAGVCAAAAGVFSAYHQKLFAEQPAEGSAGLTNQELIDKGTQVGAPASFATCVNSGTYSKSAAAETARAIKDTSLRAPDSDGFGTPTVMANGKRVDLSDSSWLTNLTKAG
jgi:protein-disulfide isomerase